VGVILVLALITPGATAYLLVKRLNQMMILGAMIGIASISGMYISYFSICPLVQQLSSRVSLVYVGVTIQPSQGILTYPQSNSGLPLWQELKSLIRWRS